MYEMQYVKGTTAQDFFPYHFSEFNPSNPPDLLDEAF